MPSSGSLSIRPPKKLGLQNLPEFQTKHVSRPGFELTTSRTGDVRPNQLRQSDMPNSIESVYLNQISGMRKHLIYGALFVTSTILFRYDLSVCMSIQCACVCLKINCKTILYRVFAHDSRIKCCECT